MKSYSYCYKRERSTAYTDPQLFLFLYKQLRHVSPLVWYL